VFQKAKDRPPEHQVTGIVYKVKCESCSFVHIRESKSSGNSPGEGGGAERKPGTRGNNDSAIKQHAETTGHDIHPSYVEILKRGVNNRQKPLFLESIHSTPATNAVNERHPLPTAYLTFGASPRDLDKS